jgi:rSAM/selenodomain-associated transferase 1
MLGTVILFARAPRLGVGKTRLARDIGRIAARRFQREMLRANLRELPRGPWRFRVAVADPRDRAHPAFDGVATLPQAPGDLGARMRDALAQAPPGPAVIVGGDIPGITAGHLRAAFRALGRTDAVFGPAPDGGYWLVGLARRRPVPRGFMRGVRWSGAHALADTLATLPSGATVSMLDTLADVDDGASYATYRGR